ncbi:hypothetical protein CP533_2965 [Ophiocordyceps camponoti-saundersi (nom. inval.)]|nr:hypothetical protein CP533_2965 [Ophiocordyceps camponoti-saundersi (nom. inval.)]
MAPPQPELKKVRAFRSAIRGALQQDNSREPDGFTRASTSANSPAQYLEKRLFVQLNGSRKVIGILRGYDVFLNIVLDEAYEEVSDNVKIKLGMVVIRGNSVVMLEAMDRIGGDERQQQHR